MKRFFSRATALALLAPLGAAQDRVDLFDHVVFRDGVSKAVYPRSSRPQPVDMDSAIAIDFDEAKLLLALGKAHGQISVTATRLEARIDQLRVAVDGFLKAQQALLDLRVEEGALARAKAAHSAELVTAASQRVQATASRMAEPGAAAIQSLKAYRASVVEEGDGVRAVELGEDFKKLDAAVLQGSYEPMTKTLGEILDRELGRLQGEVGRDLSTGDQYAVSVDAELYDGSGGKTGVHVDGYDSIAPGARLPYQRFQFAPSERSQREYEAAEKLKEVVDAAHDGTLGEELRKARAAVVAELKVLRDTLKSDVLIPDLDKLRDALVAIGGPAVLDVLKDLKALRDLLQSLQQDFGSGTGTDLPSFLQLAAQFHDAVNSLLAHIVELPDLASKLVKELTAFPQVVASDAFQTLEAAETELASNTDVQALKTRLVDLLEAFGLATSVASKAVDVERQARALVASASIDTSVDLQTVSTRHPDDILVITIVVERKLKDEDRTVVELQGSQSFRLRIYGLYDVTRGALFFADPRNGSIAPGQDYEAVPTIGYVFHYGMRGQATFWNDVLDPGLALSLSLMDFDDTHSLELGVSGGVTLFKDLLWVGYGRDLQANANFFYIGLNPLVLGELWRQNSASPAGNN